LGTHLHLVAKGMCSESFYEMKNMVANEVYRMPTATFVAIVLSTNNFFLSHHLFNEDGEGQVEPVKVEKLNKHC
jgi:hypothetical protein